MRKASGDVSDCMLVSSGSRYSGSWLRTWAVLRTLCKQRAQAGRTFAEISAARLVAVVQGP